MKLHGWRNLGGSVWAHVSGIRLHLLGMVVLRCGRCFWANEWPESQLVDRAVRIAGGRRRGLMLWAQRKAEQ